MTESPQLSSQSSSPSQGSLKKVSFSLRDPPQLPKPAEGSEQRLLSPRAPPPPLDEGADEEASASSSTETFPQAKPAAAAEAEVLLKPLPQQAAVPAVPAKSAVSPLPPAKSIIKKESISVMSERPPVFCSECNEYIPAAEWPNHRDRLRTVNLQDKVSRFQRMVTTFIVDTFMWILVNVYFREVAVVGLENVPKTGPVVFYGNHQNQFIDAMMIRAHCGRPVRFIIAEKSMTRPVIGQFARLMEAVPVVRPQDVGLLQGQGKIVSVANDVIVGEGTAFRTNLAMGDVISWNVPSKKERCSAQVLLIISDTQLQVTLPVVEADKPLSGTQYHFSRRIDHSEMYAEVYNTLAKGHCIGIFPEGGSHDRTSLQPLKAGVALFSLGAAERGIHPMIVPCGLTYFYGHKFRSRAHIEFGEPITPSKELVTIFESNKRLATGQLLETLNANLRAVTINVSDWDALKLLHSLRRLYQPTNLLLQTRDYLRLTRRLSILIEERADDPEFADFRNKVQNYNDFCAALLVRDSQAATLEKLDEVKTTYTLLFRRLVMLISMWLVLVPFFVVATPVGIISNFLSERHAKSALSSSSVKVVAADVKGSYKIISGFILAPLECIAASLLVLYYTDMRTALTVFFSLPMAMYVSLLILHEAVLELRAALPLIMSLFSKHKQFRKLFERRKKLVAHAKDIVKKFDPSLEKELEDYASQYSGTTREPSLFSLRHNQRRAADKRK